jgi:gluconokinase
MGVAGAGKTTVGRALARSLGWDFHDADDFHPAGNVAKMRGGSALTDADRAPWLAALRELLARHLAAGTPVVLACSALRQRYRAALVPAGVAERDVLFVQLDVSPALARRRLEAREGHYMGAALLASQFETLEAAPAALRLDASRPVGELVGQIMEAVR